MSEVSHFCLQIVLFNLISSYNSKLVKTNWQRRKVLFILCWSGKNQELSQFLLQGKKKRTIVTDGLWTFSIQPTTVELLKRKELVQKFTGKMSEKSLPQFLKCNVMS